MFVRGNPNATDEEERKWSYQMVQEVSSYL